MSTLIQIDTDDKHHKPVKSKSATNSRRKTPPIQSRKLKQLQDYDLDHIKKQIYPRIPLFITIVTTIFICILIATIFHYRSTMLNLHEHNKQLNIYILQLNKQNEQINH